jgi:hypothetical protein
MKLPVVLLGLLALAWPLPAQRPSTAAHHSLSLEANVTETGGASKASTTLNQDPGGKPLAGGSTSAEQDDYKSNRTKNSGLGLDVKVRNLAPAQDQATIEWYFFGKAVEKNNLGKEFIFDTGSKQISINPGAEEDLPVRSSDLTMKEERHLHINTGTSSTGGAIPPAASTKKSGAKVSGWMVRLIAEGKVLAVRASSTTLEDLAKNDGALVNYPRKEKK